ncbi:DNA-formamidopyrimidine glycosylase family protein [Aerococcus sp. Group 1]|uniref:DNA-formamidopyrimidine glycosylase family protein n=1 Tax=Aerococcus urinae (strain CCUG 59500 / ACS-120-V-Col10a) TaxID=2976812 RepID=UPI0003139E82|nr:DNA-formamidopyrimidine glycosylase family protein [Aerococcus sp. Group 1]
MPELPEVENVRQGLNRVLPQAQIQDVEVKWAKIINCPAQVFRQAMQGETFERVDRYGKYLFFIGAIAPGLAICGWKASILSAIGRRQF